MPQTIIKIKTFMCPLGIGNTDGECRFHVAVDKMPADGKCPFHRLELGKTSRDEDKITVTVMGEEDIEKELDEKHPRPLQEKIAGSAAKDPDSYRDERKQVIKEAIAEARKLEDTD